MSDKNISEGIADTSRSAGDSIASGAHKAGDTLASGAHKVGLGADVAMGARLVSDKVATGAHTLFDKAALMTHYVAEKATEAVHKTGDFAAEAVHKTTDPWHLREDKDRAIEQAEPQRRRIDFDESKPMTVSDSLRDESKPAVVVHDTAESRIAQAEAKITKTAHDISDKFMTGAHDLGVKAHDAITSIKSTLHPHISEDERLMRVVNSGAEMDPSLPGGLRKRSFDDIDTTERFDKLE